MVLRMTKVTLLTELPSTHGDAPCTTSGALPFYDIMRLAC